MKKPIYLSIDIMSQKVILYVGFIVLFTQCISPRLKVDYKFMGKYGYKITDDSLFMNTYLYDSFGFLIGDLEIQGIEMFIDSLSVDNDYIVSLSYPVKAVYQDSKRTKTEELNYITKIPLSIIQDKSKIFNSVFIYQLNVKGKYRLLLP